MPACLLRQCTWGASLHSKHKKWPAEWITSKLNPLITMYVVGIALGQTGLNKVPAVASVLDLLSQGTVALSLPLLLFGADLLSLRTVGWKCAAAMVMGSFAMVLSSSAAYWAVQGELGPDAAYVAGIITAICSGGTQNGASVAAALNVDKSLFIATHTCEVVMGALYVLAIMTVAKPALATFMKPYKPVPTAEPATEQEGQDQQPAPGAALEAGGGAQDDPERSTSEGGQGAPSPAPASATQGTSSAVTPSAEALLADRKSSAGPSACASKPPALARVSAGIDQFVDLMQWKYARPVAAAVGLALLIVGVAAGLPMAFPPDARRDFGTLVTILLITTFGLGLSFVPAVQALPHTFTVGQYVILVFALSVGMLASVEELIHTSPFLFAQVALSMVLGMALHVLGCWAVGIDVDTLLVASVSNICSPPFVPIATQATGNEDLLVPGISVGLLGYAYGSYVGIGVASLWRGVG